MKAQSILEYVFIAMLVIAGIIVMGPYVIRSTNAHFKLWDEATQDVVNDRHVPVHLHVTGDCHCDPPVAGACGGMGWAIQQCAPSERLYASRCTPPTCGFGTSAYTESCVSDPACCGQYYSCSSTHGNSDPKTAGCCGNVRTRTSGSPDAHGLLPANPSATADPQSVCYAGEEIMQNQCGSNPPSGIPAVMCKVNSLCDFFCQSSIPFDPNMVALCPNYNVGLTNDTPITYVAQTCSASNSICCDTTPHVPCRAYCLSGGQYNPDTGSCCHVFDTPGTYPWTPTTSAVSVEVWGAGGGGGGGGAGGGSVDGGGGGGGALVIEPQLLVNPNQGYYIHVGAGGQSGSANNGNAGGGESSWFSTLVTGSNNSFYLEASGGAGGRGNVVGGGGGTYVVYGIPAPTVYNGGHGGVASIGGGGGGGAGGGGQGGYGSCQYIYPNGCCSQPGSAGAGPVSYGGGRGGDSIGDCGSGLGGGRGSCGPTTVCLSSGNASVPGGGAAGAGAGLAGGSGANGKVIICPVAAHIIQFAFDNGGTIYASDASGSQGQQLALQTDVEYPSSGEGYKVLSSFTLNNVTPGQTTYLLAHITSGSGEIGVAIQDATTGRCFTQVNTSYPVVDVPPGELWASSHCWIDLGPSSSYITLLLKETMN